MQSYAQKDYFSTLLSSTILVEKQAINLVPRVFHPHTLWGEKMKDPGNQVGRLSLAINW